MNIYDYLKKQTWSRYEDPSGLAYIPKWSTTERETAMRLPKLNRLILNQDDLLQELNSSCHLIYNVLHRSNRIKYKYNPETKKNEEDGYDPVIRNSTPWQSAIAAKKASCCFGNGPTINNEGEESDSTMVQEVKSKMNTMNIQACLSLLGNSVFRTGDAGVYFFRDDENIGYKVFSYEKGDNCTISADYEDQSKTMGVRYFVSNDMESVEFYREKTVELFVKKAGQDINLNDLYKNMPTGVQETEDGFTMVSKVEHGLPLNPFVYFRIEDVPWGQVQSNIEYWETLMSDCGENIKYYAYQILHITGGLISLPEANIGGKVIASKGEKGDAKMLEPADASNTLTIGLKNTFNAICEGSNTVFIRPDELKGQNDSGAYLRNLYHPEVQYAKLFYGEFDQTFKSILKIIVAITGRIKGSQADYNRLEISYKIEPFIPRNDTEDTTAINESLRDGSISRKTAMEKNPYAHPKESQRVDGEVIIDPSTGLAIEGD